GEGSGGRTDPGTTRGADRSRARRPRHAEATGDAGAAAAPRRGGGVD
ncbi:MAG: hypothetical protein AVDCRST_MAG50-1196, partial [uncultured Acidimicrobiales bacterium]